MVANASTRLTPNDAEKLARAWVSAIDAEENYVFQAEQLSRCGFPFEQGTHIWYLACSADRLCVHHERVLAQAAQGWLVAHEALCMLASRLVAKRQQLSERLATYLISVARKNGRHGRGRGRNAYDLLHRDHMITLAVDILVGQGYSFTRNEVTTEESACSIVATALKGSNIDMKENNVARIWRSAQSRAWGGAGPSLPAAHEDRLNSLIDDDPRRIALEMRAKDILASIEARIQHGGAIDKPLSDEYLIEEADSFIRDQEIFLTEYRAGAAWLKANNADRRKERQRLVDSMIKQIVKAGS
jgi:hypothetical protein